MQTPLIRPATLSDLPTLVRFQLAMAEESEGLKLDPAVLEKGVRAVFEDPNRGVYSVAVVGGEVVACLLLQREWSDWRNRWVYWIHSLYVTPLHRAQGISRRFYEYLQIRVANEKDAGGLRLYVDRKNTNAIQVYEKLGMSAEHYALYEWLK